MKKPGLEILLIAIFLSGMANAADSWQLTAAEWSRPRSGERVVALPAVAEAVRSWHAQSGVMVVHHPGGEEGALWAAELRDWLVALGIDADAIRLVPGGVPVNRIDLSIEGSR